MKVAIFIAACFFGFLGMIFYVDELQRQQR